MLFEFLLDKDKASVDFSNFGDYPTNEVRALQKLFEEEDSRMFLLYLNTCYHVKRMF
jgi:hypothetical protein